MATAQTYLYSAARIVARIIYYRRIIIIIRAIDFIVKNVE